MFRSRHCGLFLGHLLLLAVMVSCVFPDGENDYVKGIRSRAEWGDKMAQYDLGTKYYYGSGVRQDYEEAFRWFMKSADKEYAIAQYSVGFCYFKGNGVHRDPVKAVEYIRMSADQGYPKAVFDYGCMVLEGVGVKKNKREAVGLLEKAAGLQYLGAMYILGTFYLNDAEERNESKALYWIKRAAYHGMPEAQFQLGNWYAKGDLLKQDREQAVRWFQKAYTQGFNPAIQDESFVRSFLIFLTQKQEPITEKRYLLRLPEEKELEVESVALYQQGFKALFGLGVEQNNAEAINCLMLSTLKGNKSAKMLLSYCCATGTGTLKSPDKAVYLFVGKGRIQYPDYGGLNTIDFEIFKDGTFEGKSSWKKEGQ